MPSAISRWMARHRANPLAHGLMKLARSLIRGYHNLAYDARTNGEAFLIDAIAATWSEPTVFDVGANHGAWTGLVLAAAPKARVHAFELVPATAADLAQRFAGDARVTVNAVGLSDRAGAVPVYLSAGSDQLATAVADWDRGRSVLVGVCLAGDDYVERHGIERIALLKIDVEGGELAVLRGFRRALDRGAIAAIQFEYGRINAANRTLLRDFYDLLEPLGYRLGKLFPRSVDFRPHHWDLEGFIGLNYVAAHRGEAGLLGRLGWREAPGPPERVI
jgi:FkbM family methyltransferase